MGFRLQLWRRLWRRIIRRLVTGSYRIRSITRVHVLCKQCYTTKDVERLGFPSGAAEPLNAAVSDRPGGDLRTD